MLTDASLEQILARIPDLTIGVLGDLFLDRYLDLDAALTEPSLETGLDAYQVVRVRSAPAAAGTVINNLAALGVGRVLPVAVIGDDGEGYELSQELSELGVVHQHGIFVWESLRTPTYMKPILHEPGRPGRELNRLDIKNRRPLPAGAEDRVLESLDQVLPQVDVLIVVDQVSEPESGVVTARVRNRLAELGTAQPARMILVDSRDRIELFHSVWLKPNEAECQRAVGKAARIEECAAEVARTAGRPLFCTRGERGILVVDPRLEPLACFQVPAYPVTGPVDIVGAGDSCSAAIACAVAAGMGLGEAAAFGNLVASITIQQIGTTGTASPAQIRQRWAEVGSASRGV
jgi:rfaE bifunctional protein kinase chain/domain